MAHSPYWVDYQAVKATTGLGCLDTEDVAQETEAGEGGATIVPVVISQEQVSYLLSQYDPNSGTSPLVAIARPLARLILDALLRKSNEEAQEQP